MKISKIIVLALTGAVLVFPLAAAAVTAKASTAMREEVRGEAFTDPSYRFTMPEEWIKKPVTYEEFAKEANVAVTLEQDVYHLVLPLLQKYIQEHPGVKIAVQEGTCGISAGALARKAVDIGGFCCPPGKEDRLPGLKYHTLGIVAKAFFVNPGNPVSGISTKQLRDIFSGKTYRWSDAIFADGRTGPDWKIRTIGRFHCQARPGHWRLLFKDSEQFSPRLHEVGSIPDMIAEVAKRKDAIGWEVLGMAEEYESLGKVKPLRIDGHLPTDVAALATGKYPFYRTYNITTWEGKGVENAGAKRLVEYLMKEAERIDSKYGFVPASRLHKAGWKFKDDELIGEPR
jgi:ABC-type phosphate transport system substrate-binding protein